MLSFKPNVRLSALSPQMVLAVTVINDLFRIYYNTNCTITSVNDSTHGADSLHGVGRAIDFRTKHIAIGDLDRAEKLRFLRQRVADALTSEFDVVLEAVNKDNEHLHVEYDPKFAASQTKA